jgi:hypothetical protein
VEEAITRGFEGKEFSVKVQEEEGRQLLQVKEERVHIFGVNQKIINYDTIHILKSYPKRYFD